MTTDEPRLSRKALVLEILSVALIALTAVLTAWSAFESSKWSGTMTIHFNEAGAARTESVRQSNVANREASIDVALFTNYANAVATDDTKLADFYQQRFPDRLGVAVTAWLKTDPLVNPKAPASPFDMKEYHLDSADKADQLEAKANRNSLQARQANQRSDNYTITSVFFATVILLAALGTKLDRDSLQIGLMIGATLLFIATAIVIASYPVEI